MTALLSFISFHIGMNIYVDLRSYDHGLFAEWSRWAFFHLSKDTVASDFVLYNLPDGLWLSSLLALMVSIWGLESLGTLFVWMGISLTGAFVLEFLQWAQLLQGTFDILDVGVYLLAFAVVGLLVLFMRKKIL